MPRARLTYPLRGAVRTLEVLRAVNDTSGAGVSALAQRTRIPRPSLYRILETLCALGYVQRRADGEGYAPTILVRSLSDGFSDETWVRAAALQGQDAATGENGVRRSAIWRHEDVRD